MNRLTLLASVALSGLALSAQAQVGPLDARNNLADVPNKAAALANLGAAPAAGAAVTTTYTAQGAIALTDQLSVVNASTAVTMTIANGGASPIQLQINNVGTGAATISATINGGANTVYLSPSPNPASLTLRWLPAPLSTWVII